ncbi:hypothetical protein NLG97_g5368 [Lecanicillium saksenae]|uniref:Uncharacterized protein n=1 Tax=Lecanicillium saksenae TaxID=468837 RepID=A0ACC1QV78_9HYPO|nr:hypothetical protein NLG97_g5368 [Lecanicillium saksenae]
MKSTQFSAAAMFFLAGLGLSSPVQTDDVAAQPAAQSDVQSAAELAAERETELAILRGCDQGDCPDNDFGFDLYSYVSGGKWKYKIRWQGICGCNDVSTSDDGCATLNICSGKQTVCIDHGRGRGHWIDPHGTRKCYAISSGYVCNDLWEAWPTREVACAW